MNLICRVFVLSVCVFTVCALPNFGNLHELQGKLIHTFAANNTGNSTSNSTDNNCSVILPPGNSTGNNNSTSNSTDCPIILPPGNNTNNGTGNSTEKGCIELYTIEVDEINALTAVQSEQCYVSGQIMMASLNATINSTTESVDRQARQIQHRLNMCSNQSTNEAMFNCYTHTFDKNLQNLNSIAVQSEVASAALSGYAYEVEITTQACIGQILVNSKTNSTIAANKMQVCLQQEREEELKPGNGNHFGPGPHN